MGVPRGFTNGGTEPTVAKRRDPDGQTHSLSLHRALRGASTENATVTLFSVSSSLTPFLRL